MTEIVKHYETQIFDFESLINESLSDEKIKNFKQEVEKNKLNKKSSLDYNFLPIDVIQDELDTFFLSDWHTVNVKYAMKLNSIICNLSLVVFHPILKKYVKRHGTGGCQLQLKSGEKEITPYSLNHDSVRMAYKRSYTDAVKNAAQTLGKRFGRSLNREEHQFETLLEITQRQETERLEQMEKNELISVVFQIIESQEKLTASQKAAKKEQAKNQSVTNLKKFIENASKTV